MKHLPRRINAGFSLIEVLIALVILGVGLMGLARLQLFLLAGTADTAAYDTAIRLGNERLESLRFERLSGGVPVSGAEDQSMQGIAFNRSWTVDCTAEQSCHARVLVRWVEPRASEGSMPREMLIEAYLAPASGTEQGWLVQSGPPSRETLP